MVLLLVLAIAVYFCFDLGQYSSLEVFKAQCVQIVAAKEAHPALCIGGFLILYIAVAAQSLFGPVTIQMVSRALFGLVTSAITVSFVRVLARCSY